MEESQWRNGVDMTNSSSASFKWSPSRAGKLRWEPTQWNVSLRMRGMRNVKPAQADEKGAGQAILRIFDRG
jgi:hypothetical protein